MAGVGAHCGKAELLANNIVIAIEDIFSSWNYLLSFPYRSQRKSFLFLFT